MATSTKSRAATNWKVRLLSEEWRLGYNMERPHKSLGYLSPQVYVDLWGNSTKTAQKLYPQPPVAFTIALE